MELDERVEWLDVFDIYLSPLWPRIRWYPNIIWFINLNQMMDLQTNSGPRSVVPLPASHPKRQRPSFYQLHELVLLHEYSECLPREHVTDFITNVSSVLDKLSTAIPATEL